jgi:hypothetical protein
MKEFFDDDLRSPSVLNFIDAVILALALPPHEAAFYRRPAKVRNQGQVDDVVKTVPVIHTGIASKIVTERLALKIHRDWLSPTRTNATSKVRGKPPWYAPFRAGASFPPAASSASATRPESALGRYAFV